MTSGLNFPLMREAVLKLLPLRGPASGRERAQLFVDEGVFATSNFGLIPYDGGDVWLKTSKRTQARYFHGFLFFSDWHSTVLQDPDVTREYTSAALRIVAEWESRFGNDSAIWSISHHDETTAQRLIQLICLVRVTNGTVTDDEHELLTSVSLRTAELLSSDDFHAGNNNHGMFQDLALLYFSVMSETISNELRMSYFSTATRRLHSYFSTAFTSEGVHIENTPTYHLMVAKHVHGLLTILETGSHQHVTYYRTLLNKAAKYATHALKPNGMYPPISDTTEQFETQASRQNIFDDENFAYAASAGKIGIPPTERVLVLPVSGYAIYRSSWTDPNATFAFFSAAYNADYHKHSDDLSLFVRSGGVDLLSEAGAYGYDYKEPLTKYAYSSFAHNGLIVDGTSLPRTDKFGHHTTLEALEVRTDGFRVHGQTKRLKDTQHSRTIDISEINGNSQIIVHDVVESRTEHQYDLLWNIGTEVDVVVHGQGFELFHSGKKLLDLHFEADAPTTISLHRGETKPRYLGWRFPKFGQSEPAPVVRVRFEGSTASLKTVIRTTDFFYADRGLNAVGSKWKRSRTERGLNYLAVPAKNDRGKSKLVVVFTAIHAVGDFTFNYKQSLDAVDVNALYILDDHGDQGAYYLADHGDRSIFRSVQSLIRSELLRLGLGPSDLITAGSSKGGAAAILHGIELHAANIVVGAPQVKIGSFLQGPHPNILRYITGSESDEAVESLDREVFQSIEAMSPATHLALVVGEQDHHYRNHVKPLQAHAILHKKELEVTVLPGLPHAEIGRVYKSFLTQNVEALLSRNLPNPSYNGDSEIRVLANAVTVNVAKRTSCEIAFRLFRERVQVKARTYSHENTVSFTSLPTGRYRVRVFYRHTETRDVKAFTTEWINVS